MTRWAMAVDLRRCVGCQTCTAACKHANSTPPGVQWRRVLDIEVGEYPEVQRAFVPVGCNHCDEPACLPVCPTGATYKRPDGIVSIDYDACIGCAYCAVACPLQARGNTDQEYIANGGHALAKPAARRPPPGHRPPSRSRPSARSASTASTRAWPPARRRAWILRRRPPA